MAAIMFHSLPSCIDSQLVESRLHNLRLPSPKPLTSHSVDLSFKTCFWESNIKPHFEQNLTKIETIKSNLNEDSWSSIQSLSKSNSSQGLKENTYVHPNVKLPWHKLSPKSLELCTENLGNETGCNISEYSIDLLSSTNLARDNLEKKEERKNSRQNLRGEMRTKNFPPPLKSMRGSESVRVKPHRENGRLVIELTKVPSSASCFQADRSNGRLRLSFWNDTEVQSHSKEDKSQECEEEFENEISGQKQDAEDEDEEEQEEVKDEEVVEKNIIDNENEEVEEETHVNVCCVVNKSKGWNVGNEVIRMGNHQKYERGSRRKRCKEGGKHEHNEMLVNWGEPLWLALATS
ncbi:protein FANTASTIC FOUR 3-like [Trifolium pratense]|uniref:protein FANTASTIC FOUR 3-like n=1 Tax=Trifolium pratense TaxID=57577 RepID=UPI001E692FF6|nr:protein FANTASTIC FOUR 3-like [Trifolium pratense]